MKYIRMKRMSKILILTTFTSFIFFACSDDDATPSQNPAYIIQSTVQTPDGTRTVFLNLISSLTDEVDITEAIEFNSNSRFKVYNGKVYVFDSENVEVIRFGLDDSNDLIQEDKFSMVGIGVSGFGPSNAIVSEQHAVSLVQGIRKLVFWNPSTMEITGTIDYPDIIPESFRSGFGAAVDADGRVFIGFSGFDFATFSNQPGARLFIIDPFSQTLETIFDEEISAGTDGAVDGNGDYYLSADAYFGFGRYRVTENRDTIQTIQRVNRGENTFDPTFDLLVSDITDEGYPQMGAGGLQIKGDLFTAILLAGTDEEILANPQAAFSGTMPRKLYTGSTTDWKGTEIVFNDDTKVLNVVFVVDGEFYAVASDPQTSGSTNFGNDLYRLTEDNTLEKLTTTFGWFENMARIR